MTLQTLNCAISVEDVKRSDLDATDRKAGTYVPRLVGVNRCAELKVSGIDCPQPQELENRTRTKLTEKAWLKLIAEADQTDLKVEAWLTLRRDESN